MKWIAVLVSFALTGPASALEVLELRTSAIKGGEHVSLLLSQNVKSEVSAAASPPRVIIDFPSKDWTLKKKTYASALIKNVKIAVRDATTSRMVLEYDEEITLSHVTMVNGRKHRHHLDFDVTAAPKTAPATTPRKEQFRPKGKPVIVIDAGHGGQDPGTAGVGGVKEKRITLRFAEALRDLLLKSGRYKVTLTRDDDRYLFLKERVKIAREAGGNLFISLHADSAPSRFARGLSVYTISQKASDKESEALAAKENKADVIGGMDLSGTSQDVADILIELAERETRGKSAQFARLVMHYLSREIHLLSNTHRYAGFAVLKAPDIPSILVEVGFLSSPEEEKQLESEGYRQKVARGLANAVDAYFSKRQ